MQTRARRRQFSFDDIIYMLKWANQRKFPAKQDLDAYNVWSKWVQRKSSVSPYLDSMDSNWQLMWSRRVTILDLNIGFCYHLMCWNMASANLGGGLACYSLQINNFNWPPGESHIYTFVHGHNGWSPFKIGKRKWINRWGGFNFVRRLQRWFWYQDLRVILMVLLTGKHQSS